MSINDQRLAADIAACQSVPDLQQQLRDRDRAMEALAAENSTLKAASDRQREFILNGVEFGYIRLPDQPDTAIATHAQCIEGIKTPATEAFINSVRAEGVEMFANHCLKRRGEMMKTEPNMAVVNQAITATRRAGEFAFHFAAQLRSGEAR